MRKALKPLLLSLLLLGLAVTAWLILTDPQIVSRITALLSENEIAQRIAIEIVLPFGGVLLLSALAIRLAGRGRDRTEQILAGQRVLFLKPGAFWLGLTACLALSSAFGWAATRLADLWGGALTGGLALFFLKNALWFLRARVAYDAHSLSVTHWTLAQREYRWTHLKAIERATETMEYHLTFAPGGRAKISQFFSDLDPLLATARAQIDRNCAAQDNALLR
ncbi:hypothetical protein AADZ90_005835 [Aestuariibius sp. 2305UL40-4]|uniref:hypothetical protein n=1 Tax=Aestuariibius violaceus TaxID=3234132 RepID=UPI00345EDA3E